MQDRFRNGFSFCVEIQKILYSKETAEFTEIAQFSGVHLQSLRDEWNFVGRLHRDFSTLENQIALACSADFATPFPCLSTTMRHSLLLPVGTASVERSFSTMNRILSSERNRLSAEHMDALMKISIEGPEIPDILSSTNESEQEYLSFLESVFTEWASDSHRLS